MRKFLFLAARAAEKNEELIKTSKPVSIVQFDDLETFEHTKCKPLSVLVALEEGTRRILAYGVARMPAKGKLAAISRKKYGKRIDERPRVRKELLEKLKTCVLPTAVIKSDESPHYPYDLLRAFPNATHKTFKGRKSAVTGQGELKKTGFDPIFSINHTFAKFRADINRLFRRTWCTTKKPERLHAHIAVYVNYHNDLLGY